MRKNYLKNKKAFISIFAIFFSAIIISVMTSLYYLLIRQIDIMNIDASSFQALYTADSALECVLYKELNASSSNSIFLPSHSGDLGFCSDVGDASWQSSPVITSGRSRSILNLKMTTNAGDFCAVITAGKQIDNSEISNSLLISGQSRACTDPATKIIERVIEFYY